MMWRRAVALLLLFVWMGCASTRVAHLDTREGRPPEYVPTSWDSAIAVSEDDFKESLARLVLDVPLSIRAPAAGWLVRASTHGATMDKVLQGGLRKSYGRWCRAHEGSGDCLSLLEDGLGFTSEDKLALALGLSLDPMRESIAEAVEDTLNPHFFTTVVVSVMVSWAVLAANPEPVFTKGAAILAAVLVVYLGVDSFLEVVRACSELKSLTDRATTFQELEEAGARFGRVLGHEGARIFLLAATALVSRGTAGSASWMASRLPLLPRFTEATALGASQVGLRLDAVGQVSAVAVVEESFVMAMTGQAMAPHRRANQGQCQQVRQTRHSQYPQCDCPE